jgi:hypothetical protein
MKSELLRESVEWKKKYPAERYYEANFPVFKAEECEEFRSLCEEMANRWSGSSRESNPISSGLSEEPVFQIRVGR